MEEDKNQVMNYITLQKNIQNAEADRKAFAEETLAVVQKQKTKVDFLRQENKALKNRMTEVYSKNFTKNNFLENQQEIEKKAYISECKKSIEEKEQELKKIENNIRVFQKQIIKQKSEIGGINAGQESEKNLNNQIKILENRLDKTKQKFNNVVTYNSNLKKEINSLKKERKIFDQLYEKLENNLEKKKQEIANVIKIANNAYTERDHINMEIENLKQISQQSAKDFENQLKELAIQSEKHQKHLEYTNEYIDGKNHFEDGENETIRHNLEDNQNLTDIQKCLQQQSKLETDFAKLQVTTQMTDFNELLNKFQEIEEQNFQKFNYINELSSQINNYDNQIKELEIVFSDLINLQSKSNMVRRKYEKEKNTIISDFQQEAQDTKKSAQNIEDLIKESTKEIENIFYQLGCDVMIKKHESSESLFEVTNIIDTLGIIEKKQLDILHAYGSLLQVNEKNDEFLFQKQSSENQGEQNEQKIEEIQNLIKNGDDTFFDCEKDILRYDDLKRLVLDKLRDSKKLNKTTFNKFLVQLILSVQYSIILIQFFNNNNLSQQMIYINEYDKNINTNFQYFYSKYDKIDHLFQKKDFIVYMSLQPKQQ